MSLSSTFPFENVANSWNGDGAAISETSYLEDVLEDEEEARVDRDSGQGSSIDTSPEDVAESIGEGSPSVTTSEEGSATKSTGTMIRIPRKRRRRSSSSTISAVGVLYPPVPFATRLLSSANSAFLTEGLLKIYHDTFEHALSCWLTERTCPYSKDSDLSLPNDTGPDWNRIYHRVFRLDRLASSIRGRNLSFAEDKASSKAVNLSIFAFASQWAQASQRTNAKYPFHSDKVDGRSNLFTNTEETEPGSFDRALQVSAWHQARMALQEAAEIESFRVVLAQIVFSLTQKPVEKDEQGKQKSNNEDPHASLPHAENEEKATLSAESSQVGDKDVNECEDLLSKLNLTMDGEGPPIHLEQGLRLIHSLRSRMTMSGTMARPKKTPRCWKQSRFASNRLDAADRATVDLLFWLGIMFDTLSSAMHKRPLVVSLEDSDLPAAREASQDSSPPERALNLIAKTDDLWDDYLFSRQRKRLQGRPVRWPCSHDAAASILCDAAPVKVLLFRKVTRIQTLLSRNAHGERIERAVQAALEVYEHWQKLYAPFIRDCIENHDRLPCRVQSWYICLTGHWHLATLLLADLIEIIDDAELSLESKRRQRTWSNFIATFREKNCRSLSDIARCACPREDASFPHSREFHFAVNQGALLTEPWTAVLIRAFATAGVILLDSAATPREDGQDVHDQEDAFRRADDCVRALWYLGRKSDMALSAARILGDALKQRRKGLEEKVTDMSSFLEAELWEGFDEMNGAFGVECV
ncbi:C6 transcription factor AlcR [Trematosphaeria pertusa]|uniref:C6 transcription factor AlcR n=1 Tax=Trematosphaeria pertusa TaxID=390896 RepID=A0A6A6IMD9_9PLEO|nr:C6 transcription factor AlcR [Trematosphaeria pertusa]KAF2251734.1 C6 transcription factor AlcR [Trematosphaeria pertusa]